MGTHYISRFKTNAKSPSAHGGGRFAPPLTAAYHKRYESSPMLDLGTRLRRSELLGHGMTGTKPACTAQHISTTGKQNAIIARQQDNANKSKTYKRLKYLLNRKKYRRAMNKLSYLKRKKPARFNELMSEMTQQDTHALLGNISATDRKKRQALINQIIVARVMKTAKEWVGTREIKKSRRIPVYTKNGWTMKPRVTKKKVGKLQWRGRGVIGPPVWTPLPKVKRRRSQVIAGFHEFPNDFIKWLRGGRDQPEKGRNSTMTCDEALVFAAFKAGVISKSKIQGVYMSAAAVASKKYDKEMADIPEEYTAKRRKAQKKATADATKAFNDHKKKLLVVSGKLESIKYNSTTGKIYSASTGKLIQQIPAGKMIFVGGDTHIMLSQGDTDSKGRHRVFSLWIYPGRIPENGDITDKRTHGYFQDTTLEQVLEIGHLTGKTIEYGSPFWER